MTRLRASSVLPLVLCAAGLLLVTGSQAQLLFHVSLNTAPLVGNANGPFSLDFQLTDGSGANDANNTAHISNLDFGGGGSASGTPTLTGGAAGALGTTVTLTDSQFFNELYQTFTPGASLDFDVNLTTNLDGGGTPDQFVFGILDSTLSNLPTTDPGGAFVVVDLDSASPTIQTFAAIAPYAALGAPTITVPQAMVPEPGALALLTGMVLTGAGFLRRSTAGKKAT